MESSRALVGDCDKNHVASTQEIVVEADVVKNISGTVKERLEELNRTE